MTRFERGLYADPDADHSARWWELVERYQLPAAPAGRPPARLGGEAAPGGGAGLLPQLPAGRGDGLAAAGVAVERETGAASPAQAPGESGGCCARPCSSPGASLRWDALVERATGEPLSTRDFVATLS